MSWSDEREKLAKVSDKLIKDRISNVNNVLNMLSKDEDLHDDIKTNKQVLNALKHWTGSQRLSPEVAIGIYIYIYINSN
jgi:hypothetical protein